MPNPNPLAEDNHPQEEIQPTQATNLQTSELVTLLQPAEHQFQSITIRSHRSTLQDDGTYHEQTETCLAMDNAGQAMNTQDPTQVSLSHTGLWINHKEEGAICTYWLHPSNRSRSIKLGYDGRSTAGGAICSHCLSIRNSLLLCGALLLLGVLAGIYKACWF
ncbi:hypothetical protein [Desulfovulcanus sp.]